MSQITLPYTQNCFVCGVHNEHGLQLKFRLNGDAVVTDFVPQPHHAGFRSIVHGGVLSTVLDEAMFWAAACAKKRFSLAAELTIRFLRKVSVGQQLLVVATFQEDRGRLWISRAEIRDAEEKVYARATCKQSPMNAEDMKYAAGDFLPDNNITPAEELFPDLKL